ncbi:odorant receptor 83a-like [Zophobas morio]|uniref:odorant receptor 83a-like n=1 Tax=Zophobas morio TaxID=2755281 RepID=UPI00308378F8
MVYKVDTDCVVYVYITPFNLIDEAMIIMNIAFYWSLFIHFFLFSYNSNKLVSLVEDINSKFVFKSDNKTELLTMEDPVKFTDRMAFIWTINIIIAVLTPILSTLASGHIQMPLPAWFPYDYQKSPMFEISYIWQFYCAVCLGICYGVTDMIYPCIVILVGQQFQIVGSNLKNGFYYALLTWETEEFSRINTLYLSKNVKHHLDLLQICEKVDDILSVFLMVKCAGQMFNVVFIAFSLITSGNSSAFFGLGTYIITASIMLLLYNYSGEILTQKADILWDLYETPWYLADIKFQKSFLLLQMKLTQGVYTKAGHYFTLSAQTFISNYRLIALCLLPDT